jgi:hypothetical protein
MARLRRTSLLGAAAGACAIALALGAVAWVFLSPSDAAAPGLVAGYNLPRDGAKVGSTTATSATWRDLSCATAYTPGVQSYDASGAVSTPVTLAVRSGPCTPTLVPIVPDDVAPTSVTMSWAGGPTDLRYRLYRSAANKIAPPSSSIATVTADTYTWNKLACNTSYMLGVGAVDADGNVSAIATQATRTAACPVTTPAGACPSNPLDGVYSPSRLSVLDPKAPCRTAVGVVHSTHVEHDGDCHVNVAVDASYKSLMNAVNVAHGYLVTEIIPQHPVPAPTVGSRVSVTGTWVNDHSTGWNELHPVWGITLLSGSSGSC